MNKLKILQVNKLYYPTTGGIELVAKQIAEGLRDKTDMEVLVCREKGKTVVEEINGVKVCRAGSFGVMFSMPLSLSFFFHFRKLAKDRDIVHFHMPFPLGDMAALLCGYKGKVVLWWHSDVVRQKMMMKFYRPVMERFLKRADCIVVATQGHIDGSDYLKPYAEKCVIIPYGVEGRKEEAAERWLREQQKETAPEKREDKEAFVKFLFTGRLVYYKGCNNLLKATAKVPRADITLIGSGPLEAELKEQAEKLKINNRVHFLGNVDDEKQGICYGDCDVFVLPSNAKSEAFGIVQIEAMSYGKPVINTNLPSGAPCVSLHGKTGLTVEPDDVEALAAAMQHMIDFPQERREMGKAARKRVEEEYMEEIMLKRVLKMYRQLTGNEGK